MRKLLLLALFFITATCHASTYYISAAGSDANPGTKVSPWLHAPGMRGCTGNCASTSPTGGDAFIFRGGDTWHNTTGSPTGLKWNWQWAGSPGNYIYIGGGDQTWDNGSCSASGIVDTNGTQVLLDAYGESTVGTASHPFEPASVWNASSNWPGKSITINAVSYTIASVQNAYALTLTTSAGTQRGVTYSTSSSAWCRPILNGDKAAVIGASGTGDGNILTATGIYYVTFDMWEIRGCYATAIQLGNEGSSCIQWEPLQPSTPYTLSNLYIHDWGHAAFSSTVRNNEGWYLLGLGSQSTYGLGQEISYVKIDGSDSLDSTFYNQETGLMQSCASGNVPHGGPVATYWPEGKCPSASGIGFSANNAHHIHVKYVQNGAVTNNTLYWHDNVFERIYNVWDLAGMAYHDNASEFNGEFIGAGNPLAYNNIYRHNTVAVTFWINPEAGTNLAVFNNLLYDNLAEDVAQDFTSGGNAIYDNNTFVITSGSTVGVSGKSTFKNNHWITTDGASLAVLTGGNTETNAAAMTVATATSQGYVAATLYAPTLIGGLTVGTGTNLTSSCPLISTALCSTTSLGGYLTPALRPVGSPWDIGAYQFAGGVTPTPATRPRINNSSLFNGVIGVPYSAALSASEGSPPYSWTTASFSNGLALSAAGVLAGTPNASGDFIVPVTVTDTAGESATATLPLSISQVLLSKYALGDTFRVTLTSGRLNIRVCPNGAVVSTINNGATSQITGPAQVVNGNTYWPMSRGCVPDIFIRQ